MDSSNFKEITKFVFWYLHPVIYVIGTIGNILAFIVFSRKKFNRSVFSVYFRVLTITDSITILFAVYEFLKYQLNVKLEHMSNILCRMLLYLIHTFGPMSGWLLVVISFDRMLSIVAPTRFLTIKKNRLFQIIVCVVIVLFNLLFYVPLIISKKFIQQNSSISINNNTTNEINESKCIIQDMNLRHLINWMDFFNSTVFPFSFMILFTSITIIGLYRTRKNSRLSKDKHASIKKKKDVKFSITSIALNLCFLTFNLPIVVLNVVLTYVQLGKNDYSFYLSIVDLFYYMNFGSLFYINIIVNSLFRIEFKAMIQKF